MICWSCEKRSVAGLFCEHCGAVLPASEDLSFFAVLGEEPRLDVDVGALEKRFKEAARKVHPDKFAVADPRARKAALSQTVKLNEAWRTLRDEDRRATYLLGLGGLKVHEEADQNVKAGARERLTVPPALLMEVLELREALADARGRGDDAAVKKLAEQVRGRAAEHRTQVREALAGWSPRDGANERAKAAVAALMALRYDARFLNEVAVHETEAEGDAG